MRRQRLPPPYAIRHAAYYFTQIRRRADAISALIAAFTAVFRALMLIRYCRYYFCRHAAFIDAAMMLLFDAADTLERLMTGIYRELVGILVERAAA